MARRQSHCRLSLVFLDDEIRVIEGNQATSNDAERIAPTGIAAVQIDTGKGPLISVHVPRPIPETVCRNGMAGSGTNWRSAGAASSVYSNIGDSSSIFLGST